MRDTQKRLSYLLQAPELWHDEEQRALAQVSQGKKGRHPDSCNPILFPHLVWDYQSLAH